MKIIDSYLQELFGFGKTKNPLDKYEFVLPNDPSLPNPYNFRQLKLDPKQTKDDIKKADAEWRRIIEKGWTYAENPKDGFINVVNSVKKWGKGAGLYTIIDKGKRVGIVGFEAGFYSPKSPATSLIYVTWVHGKNYAAAGIMKLLNESFVPQYGLDGNKLNFIRIWFDPYKDNIASNTVAKNLKAEVTHIGQKQIEYKLSPPYWWNNYKLLKHNN